MARIDVQALPRSNEVCPYCRDGLQEPLWTCPGCEVDYHQACRAELGRCATLGCAAPAIVVRAPVPQQAPAEPESPITVNVHPIGPLQLLLIVVPSVLIVLYTAYSNYVAHTSEWLAPVGVSLLLSVPASCALALLTRTPRIERGERARAVAGGLRSAFETGALGAAAFLVVVLLSHWPALHSLGWPRALKTFAGGGVFFGSLAFCNRLLGFLRANPLLEIANAEPDERGPRPPRS